MGRSTAKRHWSSGELGAEFAVGLVGAVLIALRESGDKTEAAAFTCASPQQARDRAGSWHPSEFTLTDVLWRGDWLHKRPSRSVLRKLHAQCAGHTPGTEDEEEAQVELQECDRVTIVPSPSKQGCQCLQHASAGILDGSHFRTPSDAQTAAAQINQLLSRVRRVTPRVEARLSADPLDRIYLKWLKAVRPVQQPKTKPAKKAGAKR